MNNTRTRTLQRGNPEVIMQLNTRRRFQVLDVVFVRRNFRTRSGIRLYHHAGVVTRVNDGGEIEEILHFDPLFDCASEMSLATLQQALTGIRGVPQFITGEQLKKTFPLEDIHVHLEVLSLL
jgi:hypothetical protein